MNKTPKVSIIIPVFNVKDYLKCCLESVLDQTYTNYEAIIVDDGSTDSSEKICDIYQQKDDRFIVIHKSNRGLSSARNCGLDLVTGDYICFVDSDDYLEIDYLETMVKHIHNSDYDFVSCCANFVDENNNFIGRNQYDKERLEIDKEIIKTYMSSNYIEDASWNKIYRKELFKSVRYTEGIIFEDSEVIIRLLKRCKKILFLKEFKYNYRIRKGSILEYTNGNITNKSFSLKKLDLLKVYEMCAKELENTQWELSYKKRIILACADYRSKILSLRKDECGTAKQIVMDYYKRNRHILKKILSH